MSEESRRPSPPELSTGRKLLLAGVLLVSPFLLLEGVARLVLEPPPANALAGLTRGAEPHDELLWRNAPSYERSDEHGPINDLALRGPEVRLEKRPGRTRILSLGESSAFGDSVTWDQTYARRLEILLRDRGFDVEVWNGGVRAWSTVQTLRFLEMEIDRLQPDVVLFYHELNDFLPTVWRSAKFASGGLTDLETMAISSKRSWLLRILRSSRLLTWISLLRLRAEADEVLKAAAEQADWDVVEIMLLPYQRLARQLAERPGAQPPEGELPWMENPSRLVRVPDEERARALHELVRLTRARGAEPVFFHPAYRISIPHRCLLVRIAEEEGVPWLEVEDLLLEQAALQGRERGDYFLPGDNFHPTPEGHRVLALGMADLLVRERLVGAATTGD